MGDRTLSCWANHALFYHFSTYSYTNMNGGGNSNAAKNMPAHNGANTAWHFIYFGYSKTENRAYAFVKLRTGL